MIITLNGFKCSGKTTLSKMLSENGYGRYSCFFSLRDHFGSDFYDALNRNDIREPELMGASALGWFTADFHKRKMFDAESLVLDSYLADYYVQVIGNWDISHYEKALTFIENQLNIPSLDDGIHFYLSIDYETYLERRQTRFNDPGSKIVNDARSFSQLSNRL